MLRSNYRVLGVADVTSLNVGSSRAAVHETAVLHGAPMTSLRRVRSYRRTITHVVGAIRVLGARISGPVPGPDIPLAGTA
jgi:hypothetical protein